MKRSIHKSVLVAVALLISAALGFPDLHPQAPAQKEKAAQNKQDEQDKQDKQDKQDNIDKQDTQDIQDKQNKEVQFDINDLTERVRNSSAIGIFTKLSLRNQVHDLLDDFRRFHDAGRNDPPLQQLHERFNLLVMKLISLLQDRDPKLSSDIFQARGTLWSKLADREEFRKMTMKSKQSAVRPHIAAIFSLAWAASPPSPSVSTAEDLTAVIALQGKPCNKVVSHEKRGENDFIARCETGDVYRVYIDDKGRVRIEKQ